MNEAAQEGAGLSSESWLWPCCFRSPCSGGLSGSPRQGARWNRWGCPEGGRTSGALAGGWWSLHKPGGYGPDWRPDGCNPGVDHNWHQSAAPPRTSRWARPKYWASKTRTRLFFWVHTHNQRPAIFFPGGCSSQSSPASAPRKHPKAFPLSLRTSGTLSQTITLSGFRWPART